MRKAISSTLYNLPISSNNPRDMGLARGACHALALVGIQADVISREELESLYALSKDLLELETALARPKKNGYDAAFILKLQNRVTEKHAALVKQLWVESIESRLAKEEVKESKK